MAEEKSAQPKKKDHTIVIAVVVGAIFTFFLSLFIISCYTKDAPAAWAKWDGKSPEPNAEILVVLDGGETEGCLSNSCYGSVTGRVINRTGRRLNYVQIDVGIYQSSVKKAVCLDNVTMLDEGGDWEFSASCVDLPQSDWSYKIEDVVFY